MRTSAFQTVPAKTSAFSSNSTRAGIPCRSSVFHLAEQAQDCRDRPLVRLVAGMRPVKVSCPAAEGHADRRSLPLPHCGSEVNEEALDIRPAQVRRLRVPTKCRQGPLVPAQFCMISDSDIIRQLACSPALSGGRRTPHPASHTEYRRWIRQRRLGAAGSRVAGSRKVKSPCVACRASRNRWERRAGASENGRAGKRRGGLTAARTASLTPP